MKKTAINLSSLPAPAASFNRALELDFGGHKLLIISGTASVGPKCRTMHKGKFDLQARQAYKNIKDILINRGLKVKDVVKWTIYLKNIDKDYALFNKVRDQFFKENKAARKDMGASVCVQAKLCRKDLLVEIEATALTKK